MRIPVLVILALVAALALAAGASAATLTDSGGVLTFTAGAGAADTTSIEAMGSAIRFSGSGETVSASGCTVVTAGSVFDCSGVTRVVVDLGDRDDSFTSDVASAISLTVQGGDGNDFLQGADSTGDTIDGGNGNDVVLGLDGADTLTGGAGDDDVEGGVGNDVIDGGAGDDDVDGGAGADDLHGGSGIDSAFPVGTGNPAPDVRGTLDDSADDGGPGEADNVHSDVENLDGGSFAATSGAPSDGLVTLVGSAASNSLSVSSGRGILDGGAGNDVLGGGPLDDTITSRDGYADVVTCGEGADTVIADTFDTVSDSCENVQRAAVALPGAPAPAPDAQPTVAWTGPAEHATIAGSAKTTLTASAGDDHGIAKVQFLADTRLLCEDTTAPYSCVYSPRGDEGGLRTLEAVAIDGAQQAATALKSVTVGRFTPVLSLSVSPSSDRTPPLHFRAHGRLTLPSGMTHSIGCSTGTVTVRIEAGTKTVSTRHIDLEHDCTYSSSIAFHSRSSFGKATVLHLTARFGGSAVLTAASAKRRSARIR
jgi:Ca2+-binding RTX toxin-like protein